MAERTGAGDPLRVVPLLWRTGTRKGRRGLTLDAIVEAGIALAREAGLDELSMRKLAERLDVGTMSLYAHVPGRAELLELLVDRAFAEVRYDAATLDPTRWRAALEAVAEQNWQLLARHQWLLGVDTTRPPLGPGTIGKYDAELAALVGTGLDDVEIDQVLSLVLEHVKSTARQSFAKGEARTSDGEWWASAGPILASLLDPARYPHASRIGEAAGREYGAPVDPQRAYDFGLRTILDGVEALVTAKAGSRSRA